MQPHHDSAHTQAAGTTRPRARPVGVPRCRRGRTVTATADTVVSGATRAIVTNTADIARPCRAGQRGWVRPVREVDQVGTENGPQQQADRDYHVEDQDRQPPSGRQPAIGVQQHADGRDQHYGRHRGPAVEPAGPLAAGSPRVKAAPA